MPVTDEWTDVEVPEPFSQFYRSEYSAVVAVVYAVSGSGTAAEDIAQEAFVRAHREWERVAAMESPGGWVRRVAMNLARSRWRRLRAEAAALGRLSPVSVFVPPDGSGSVFWNEVRHLPTRQAQALTLRYLEDQSVGEIAQVLGVAEGTAKALLHQGRERLRRQLVAKGLVDDGA